METTAEKTAPVLAVVITLAVVGLTAAKIEVPTQLWAGFAVVIGFFFGQVTTQARLRAK